MSKIVLAIDHDSLALARLIRKLERDFGGYEVLRLCPEDETSEGIVATCKRYFEHLLDENVELEVILCDVVFFEEQDGPHDKTGLYIAGCAKAILPHVPVIALTRHYKFHRILFECSSDLCFDGILIKELVFQEDFSRREFNEVISRARLRAHCTAVAHEPSGEDGSTAFRFQIQDDPTCVNQVQQIGRSCLERLLRTMFPRSEGTVSRLRSGFSGSALFRVAVVEDQADHADWWAVKLSRNGPGLSTELEGTVRAGKRLVDSAYAPPRRTQVVRSGGWYGAAYRLRSEMRTLTESLETEENFSSGVRNVMPYIVDVLEQFYGEPKTRAPFLWKTYYDLSSAARSAALSQVEQLLKVATEWSGVSSADLAVLAQFVRSEGKAAPRILDIKKEIRVRDIHGDLNGGNVLVGSGPSDIALLDFAQSGMYHSLRDIIKLEVDIVLAALDAGRLVHTDWRQGERWRVIVQSYELQKVLTCGEEASDGSAIDVVRPLRKGARRIDPVCAPEEYIIGALSYLIRYLGYPDITIQKKALAAACASAIIKQF